MAAGELSDEDLLRPAAPQQPIDVTRPKLANPDGSFSTERTITVESGGRHYLIPTIVAGRQRGDDEAIRLWESGQNAHVGAYGSAQEADAAARARSAEIGRVRGVQPPPVRELSDADLMAPQAPPPRAPAAPAAPATPFPQGQTVAQMFPTAEVQPQQRTWLQDIPAGLRATVNRMNAFGDVLAVGLAERISQITGGRVQIRSQEDLERWVRRAQEANRAAEQDGPQTIAGTVAGVAPYLIPGVAGMLPAVEATNRMLALQSQGVDPSTANQAAAAEFGVQAAGVGLPAGRGLVRGAAIGAGTAGAAQGASDLATQSILERAGFTDVAKQYQPTLERMGTAAAFGGVLGGGLGAAVQPPGPAAARFLDTLSRIRGDVPRIFQRNRPMTEADTGVIPVPEGVGAAAPAGPVGERMPDGRIEPSMPRIGPDRPEVGTIPEQPRVVTVDLTQQVPGAGTVPGGTVEAPLPAPGVAYGDLPVSTPQTTRPPRQRPPEAPPRTAMELALEAAQQRARERVGRDYAARTPQTQEERLAQMNTQAKDAAFAQAEAEAAMVRELEMGRLQREGQLTKEPIPGGEPTPPRPNSESWPDTFNYPALRYPGREPPPTAPVETPTPVRPEAAAPPARASAAYQEHPTFARFPPEQQQRIVALVDQAEAVKPRFDAVIEDVATAIGGQAKTAPLKGAERALAKSLSDYDGVPLTADGKQRLRDIVRATIAVERPEQAVDAVQRLRGRYFILDDSRNLLDPGAPPPIDGYRDAKLSVVVDGHIAEVQINHPLMLAAKQEAHPLFVERSRLEREIKAAEGAPGSADIAELRRQIGELNAQMRAIYEPVWERISAANRSAEMGAPLRRADSGSNTLTRSGNVSQAAEYGTPGASAPSVTGMPSTLKNSVPGEKSGSSIASTSKPIIPPPPPAPKSDAAAAFKRGAPAPKKQQAAQPLPRSMSNLLADVLGSHGGDRASARKALAQAIDEDANGGAKVWRPVLDELDALDAKPGTPGATSSALGVGEVGQAARALAGTYRRWVGEPAYQLLQRHPGASTSAAMGFSAGVASADEDAPVLEKIGRGLAGAALGFAGAKGLGRIPTKDGRVSDTASRWFIDNYGLRPEYVQMRKAMGAHQNSIADQFLTIAREAAALPREQRRLLYSILQGEAPRQAGLAALNDRARAAITELGQRMVDYGMLAKETFEKNAATYLHRSYTSKLPGTQPSGVTRAVKMIGSELKPRGVLKDVAAGDVERFKAAGWEEFGRAQPGAKSRTMRWQLTKEQRQQLGEIEDAAYAIAETGRLMSRDVSAFKFFDDVARRFASDVEQPGYLQVSTDKIPKTAMAKFGNLAGKWLPDDIYEDVTRMVAMRNFMDLPGVREYRALNAWWKTTKTALNPVVHTNNVLSNMVLYDLSDASWSHVARAAKELALAKSGKNAPLWDMAKRAGVFDANMANVELARASRELLEQYAQVRTQPAGPLKKAVELGQATWRQTGGRMIDLYQVEDSMFRLGVFSDRLRKGMSVEDAAAEARRWFVDYDINAPGIEVLRNTATPFIAYTYRVIPLLAEAATTRPWKFAKWALLAAGVNALGENLGGGDTEAERAAMPERQRGELWGLPFMPSQAVKMPFQVGDTPQYLDVTRWLPGGDLTEINQDNTFVPGLPTPLQPNFGALGSVIAAGQGYDPFRGKKLEGLGYSIGEDAKIKGKFLASQFMPNFPGIPGAYSTTKIADAWAGRASPLGDVLPTWQAVLQSVGVKLNPADLEKMQARQLAEMQRDLEAAGEVMRGYGRDASIGRITQEQFAERASEFEETVRKIMAKYQRRLIPADRPKGAGQARP